MDPFSPWWLVQLWHLNQVRVRVRVRVRLRARVRVKFGLLVFYSKHICMLQPNSNPDPHPISYPYPNANPYTNFNFKSDPYPNLNSLSVIHSTPSQDRPETPSFTSLAASTTSLSSPSRPNSVAIPQIFQPGAIGGGIDYLGIYPSKVETFTDSPRSHHSHHSRTSSINPNDESDQGEASIEEKSGYLVPTSNYKTNRAFFEKKEKEETVSANIPKTPSKIWKTPSNEGLKTSILSQKFQDGVLLIAKEKALEKERQRERERESMPPPETEQDVLPTRSVRDIVSRWSSVVKENSVVKMSKQHEEFMVGKLSANR
jgi:hypothetical protein